MEDKPHDTRRLYQQVADEIRGLIRTGQFPPLSRPPRQSANWPSSLGVSRPSLREALIALEIEGSVEIRMGSGVYVCLPAEPEPAAAPGEAGVFGESPSELMAARVAIEGAVVIMACARMSSEALDEIAQALERMRVAVEAGRSPLDDDRAFHLAIATRAGNSVLTRIVGELFDERHSRISMRISRRFETRETWVAALAEHEAILAALEAAEPLAGRGGDAGPYPKVGGPMDLDLSLGVTGLSSRVGGLRAARLAASSVQGPSRKPSCRD